MNIEQRLSELAALPVAERLLVLQTVWNNFDDALAINTTSLQQAELDRRLDAHETNPDDSLCWDQVLNQLRGKL